MKKKKEGFSEPDFLQGMIDKLPKRVSIKDIDEEESFWIYEFLEWGEWNKRTLIILLRLFFKIFICF